tara:strand:- start:11220 stop:11483 length:264 start_codon:yes stop_codon:yes gene_type:complete
MNGLSFKEMCDAKWPTSELKSWISTGKPQRFIAFVVEELQDIHNDLSIAEDSDDISVLEARLHDVISKLNDVNKYTMFPIPESEGGE